MRKILSFIGIAIFALSFAACGSDDDEPATDASVEASAKFNGQWKSEDGIEIYTFTSYSATKEITSTYGVGMTFNGTLHTSYNGSFNSELDYFYRVKPDEKKLCAWSMTDDKSHWSPVIYKEFKYEFSDNSTLILDDTDYTFGKETFIKQ